MDLKMKNPWMSAWLSAANSVAGPMRGAISAEISKAQTRLIQDWQRAWIDASMAFWFPGSKRKR